MAFDSEAASVPVGGAVANAIHDAIGVRLYRAPFTPKTVLAALSARSTA